MDSESEESSNADQDACKCPSIKMERDETDTDEENTPGASLDRAGPADFTFPNKAEGGQEADELSPAWSVDTIINLNETGAFTYEKKLMAKANGRPMPFFTFEGKRQCRLMDQYNNHQWLCGCSKRKALFCFPCLLFSYKRSSYLSGLGLTDLSNFTNYTRKHVKSPQHLSAIIALSLLGKERIDESYCQAAKQAKECHNLEVRSNREMLKHHIKAAVYLVSQGLPFQGSNANQGNFVELVSAFAFFSMNEKVKAALAGHHAFTGLDGEVQNELIEILYNMVHREITRKIQNAHYVSIIFDELTDVSNTPHLCVSVRIVHEGEMHEHFLDMVDVSADRTAVGVAEKLKSSLKISAGINKSVKIIGQSHDGASCFASEGSSIHQIIQEKWPHAQFVHCHAHKWALVVCKACESVSPEVTFFLGFVQSLCNFFKASLGRANLLCGAIPSASPTQWLSKGEVISTVEGQYEELVNVLESVSASLIYDPATRTEANLLLQQFRTLNNIFLLKLFEKIISLSDVLTLLLESNNIDPLIIKSTVEDYQKHMKALKTDRVFVELWELTGQRNPQFLQQQSNTGQISTIEHISAEELVRLKENLKTVMIKVADAVLNQLTLRFSNLAQFTGNQCFNPDNFEKLKKDKAAIANSLGYLYPHIISDWESFMSQLTILYSDANVREATQNVHDPATLLKCMNEVELSAALPIVSQALTASLTLPIAAPKDKNFSVIKRVKNYIKAARPQNRFNHMMFLCVEWSVLNSLSLQENFYDNIIDRFACMKERGINLLYK